MKKIYALIFISFIFNLINGQVTVTPYPFEINVPITITIDANSIATNCNGFSNPTKVYAHLGVGDDLNEYDISVVGNWGQDDGVGEMTNNGDGTWSITFTTNSYFNLTSEQEKYVTKMGMVFRNEDGSQEFKANGCVNFVYNVKSFQVSLTSPTLNSTSFINSGGNLSISATNTNGNANYVLKSNGLTIDTQNNISSYAFNHTNITSNQNYELEVTQGVSVISKKFSVLVDPGKSYIVATGDYDFVDGINYNHSDPTKALLMLYAGNKDFVYVAGSFNNWQPDASYAMKQDYTRNNKFWIELTGLTPDQIETYQYWVVDKTPLTDSPILVKTADPYSTLVLSPFDDPYIPSSSYPNLPPYPTGQEREVTVLQTDQTLYDWQVTNFTKPKKEDLVIYEVLIRDFDGERNFQDLIDRVGYFKNLNINAIELMPVMEFEGNESWGYNVAYHRALDKFYGTEDKLKELVDTFHQNGIAVILDIAFNHAFGRNAMERMWMLDPDGDGWGPPSSENPYFNVTATHSYSVGYDFNHSNSFTKAFVKSTLKHWIQDFKIDGFRWDLTKGFTQNCTNNEGCTNDYNSDRVAVLEEYADYCWNLDPDHYVIFEHLGVNWDANGDGKTSLDEEIEWANYRYDEGKGIMLWGKMTNPYTVIMRGYSYDPDPNPGGYGCNLGSGDISGVGHVSRGFTGKRLVGYAESHDEERVLFQTEINGNTSGQNATLFESRTQRMSAMGAILLTVPGPKMIWHFSELGMENSIFTRSDGVVNLPDNPCNYGDNGSIPGDNKLDTKPQPQWTNNWLADANRSQIYNDWSRLIQLKINEPVFEGDYSIDPESGNYMKQRIYVTDNSLSSLKDVVILANFDVTTQNITPNFPYTGNWYDLMDETGNTYINVSSISNPISIPAGGFKIYGNQASTLSTKPISKEIFSIYPNPTSTAFQINKAVGKVNIYDISGKLIKEFRGDFSSSYEFDVSNISKGLYVVKIENKNGQTHTSKLIKF